MIIIELELAGILALLALGLLRRGAGAGTKHSSAQRLAPFVAPAPPAGGELELLKRHSEGWVLVGRRPADHPDCHEARHTPGLALRHSDGAIHEGK